MAFMQHEVVNGKFWQVDTPSEGIVSAPSRYIGKGEFAEEWDADIEDVETVTGWFARLSAPGYMDCTEWSGPFDTEDAAIASLVDMYGDDDDVE